ncbi:excinuclease ABC subunit A [Candidatus Nitrosoglobus terrae]|uniref:UvrABC system protein A n=1 Tax=Candidatus Nitrosoglobus terrae TaxID=1630141 RepID=A0A1Q2SPG7_9GAMM|nr:excinuclease ABC subunit UvrA [Candidatus Nitrosoglobus terrae]BAW81022.1 excinuclease ABC subunit A [Candidatus Nitrosoglobus terrae]
MDYIYIRGARTHNLKGIDLDLPRNQLVVITGVSGSGKSSLAFDTLYAEGQRRYLESLPTYARQFLSIMEAPDVDHIGGLSPAIAIEQKSNFHNPRSTVGTITEIYDYLRLLYARVGEPRCPEHRTVLKSQTISQMVDQVLSLPLERRYMLLAPLRKEYEREYLEVLDNLAQQGFIRVRVNGEVIELGQALKLRLDKKPTIEVVVDRFRIRPDIRLRLTESFESALQLAGGLARIVSLDDLDQKEWEFSANFACPICSYTLSDLDPAFFSFNNPKGACSSCNGLGVKQSFNLEKVVLHPELSLATGAIRGWDQRNSDYYRLILSLAQHYGFSVETPFQDLPTAIRQTVLYGSGQEEISFQYRNSADKEVIRGHPFEGILPNMERRYREAQSPEIQAQLSAYLAVGVCPDCQGARLSLKARHVFVANYSLPMITALPVGQTLALFSQLHLPGQRGRIAAKIIKEIQARLTFLNNVGLEYLTLDRSVETLSGGEAQRIRLASQLGAGLVGVMYVLDEPSIGLHPRDNQRLLNTLTCLRNLGNTLIVVEHDKAAICAADYVIDVGPGAGIHGGEVIAQGTPAEIMANATSLTGQYLSGEKIIPLPLRRVTPDPHRLISLRGAHGNNLYHLDLDIPLGLMTCVTGVSGSGKSTLVNETLFRAAAQILNRASTNPAPYQKITGLQQLDKVISIDQSPIGRTPRSNPATYTGLFTLIRALLSETPEARSRGYGPGRFSFNVKGGRCESCQGEGLVKVEMRFLPDIYIPCDTCQGKQYNRETLEIRYKGKNIYEILEITIEEARDFFIHIPTAIGKLQALLDVGLSYLKLGQNAMTLSSGEAQRVKLARELSKRGRGRNLYILDEPTTGLHFHDIAQLVQVLLRLRDEGNTIVIIEHNLDVIKTADWIVDLGPEGGKGGGRIIATGTPEEIATVRDSYTGHYLAQILSR